jgi:phosphatidylglycerophosphatase C
MPSKRPLALFDLDGTLTWRDTLSDLLIREFGLWRCLAAGARLSPSLLGVLLGLVHRDVAKVQVLRHFFSGMPEAEFTNIAENYGRNHLAKLLRRQARERLDWHRKEGHRVIVISASIGDWIAPWTEMEEIELIATRLKRIDGQITGELEGPNCRGSEKINRLRERLDPQDYDPIYAYGDTQGDTAMLDIADHSTYRGLR